MEVKLEVKGLKELDKNLRELGAEAGAKTLRSALMAASKPMLDEMKENVAVRHGGLKKTLGKRSRIDKKGDKSPAIVKVGAVRKGAWRAHFTEFGTSRTRPQPFIRPALTTTDEVIERFRVMLKKRITSTAKRLGK